MSKIFNSFLFQFLSLSLIKLLFTQKCEKGKNFCDKCNISTNICIQCSLDFLIPDDQGSCKGAETCTVGKDYCEECNSKLTKCKVCSQGYFADENGGCSFTDNCLISHFGECIKCKEDFILVEKTKFCKSLSNDDFKNCLTIDKNGGFCSECEKGFYLTSGNRKCIESTEHCKESIYEQCIECTLGYYLDHSDDRKCKQNFGSDLPSHCIETEDGKNCSKCESGYYFDKEGKCPYVNYCDSSDGFNCLECKKGYFLSFNRKSCTPEEGCLNGDPDSGICENCIEGYYYDENDFKCKNNTIDGDDLKYCKRFKEECEFCESPYLLGKDGKCVNSRDCKKSEDNICVECIDDFYLTKIDKKCTHVKNCIKLDEHSVCYECKEGFYYNTRTSECIKYNEDFENCRITGYNGNSCDSCKEGFFLRKSDNLCYNNTEKGVFYMCEKSDYSGKKCLNCIEGYYRGSKDDLCVKEKNCVASKEGICIECDKSYCLDPRDGTCHYNGEIKDKKSKMYFKCTKINEDGDACEKCTEDYVLGDKGLCRNEGDCIKDEEDDVCVRCKNVSKELGFNYCLNKSFGCVRNYMNTNCLRCDNDLNFEICTECEEGYELQENGYCSLINKKA